MTRPGQLRILQRCFNRLDGSISASVQDVATHGPLRYLAPASRTSLATATLAGVHSLGMPTTTLGPAHAYHGSGSDDDDLRFSELEGLQDILRRGGPGGMAGSMAASQHLHEGEARRVMRDPLAMLMMARGVPLGISLKVQQEQDEQHKQEESEEEGRQPYRLNEDASSNSEADETAATVSSSGQEDSLNSRVSRLMRTATGLAGDGRELGRLVATAEGDSWGTTQESAGEIAQRIADSNNASRSGGGGDGEAGDGNDSDDDDLKLPPETEHKSIEAVQADLKTMDEIFEILAQVPWLDEGNVDERELRGVATLGLLGTLEEVGWQLRPGVERIWAGERDSNAIIEDMPEREQAALISILFHTNQLEEKFGPPPTVAAGATGAQQEHSP